MVTDLPEQLITQAEQQLRIFPVTEANSRRAVSTAYYAVFHLLIRTAISNWTQIEHHPQLARTFEHRRMKEASIAILKVIGRVDSEVTTSNDAVPMRLWFVANAFVDLQELRHRADYDIATPFDPLTAAVSVALVRQTFEIWTEIKDQPLSQRYLYSLLFKERS